MEHEYKEGDKVKLLFNGGGGTSTCYKPGEILTIITIYGRDSFSVQGNDRAGQIVYSCQIEPALTLPTKGDYVSIINDEGLIHLVKVTDYPKEHNGTFKTIHLEGFHLDLKSSVFHKNAVAAFTLEGNLFKDCEPTDKHWLDWCIAADCFIDKKDVPKIGDWVLIRPSSTTTITGNLNSLLGQNAEVNHIHYRGQSSKGNLLKEIFNVRISNIKPIDEGTMRSLHRSNDHLLEEKDKTIVDDGNGGFKVGDYILVESPEEHSLKISKITGFSFKQKTNSIWAYLTYINKNEDFRRHWFCCIKGNGYKSTPADENQIRWLDHCDKHDKYIAYEDIPVKIMEENKSESNIKLKSYEFPSSGWCKEGDEELGKYLANKFDSPYEPPGEIGYAWNNNSYWRINAASGKPIWTLDSLKRIIKQEKFTKEVEEGAKRYAEVPITEKRTEMLYVKGDILCITAAKSGHDFEIGEKVQIIDVTPYSYNCKSLESDAEWDITPDECIKWIPDTSRKMSKCKYKVDDILKIEKRLHGHGFAIGEHVVIKKLHYIKPFYKCSSVKRGGEWDIGEDEVTLVTDSNKNYDNKYLVDEIGQMPKYMGNCDAFDNSRPHVWLRDPADNSYMIPNEWKIDISSITNDSEKNTPIDGTSGAPHWPRRLRNLFGKTNKIEIKNRKIEPVEVKSKIKNIDKGLIVPLEPIKDRIIK